jgi:hypothetical protein
VVYEQVKDGHPATTAALFIVLLVAPLVKLPLYIHPSLGVIFLHDGVGHLRVL